MKYEVVVLNSEPERVYWRVRETGALVCRMDREEFRRLVTQKSRF
jgi:hypothetical protein